MCSLFTWAIGAAGLATSVSWMLYMVVSSAQFRGYWLGEETMRGIFSASTTSTTAVGIEGAQRLFPGAKVIAYDRDRFDFYCAAGFLFNKGPDIVAYIMRYLLLNFYECSMPDYPIVVVHGKNMVYILHRKGCISDAEEKDGQFPSDTPILVIDGLEMQDFMREKMRERFIWGRIANVVLDFVLPTWVSAVTAMSAALLLWGVCFFHQCFTSAAPAVK